VPSAILARCDYRRDTVISYKQQETYSAADLGFSLESLELRPKFTTGAAVSPSRKDLFVQRSLSVLLPVKDVQATLTTSVHQILDVLADSTDQFELLIIDDGSTDATSEVAHELTRHYPQVRVVRHGTSKGHEAAIRSGLKRSQGEVVVMRDENGRFHLLERRWATQPTFSRPTRPNYLSRLRSFVLSE
jgi:cellulose synthase/poly-beta-1,6-N-acetylglucosamine synthase-like glycosyltransferase